MVAIVMLVVVIGIIALIVASVGGKDRYAKMSEKEFEAEAKRASALGAVMTEFHKFFQLKRVEYIQQRDKRVEGEQKVSGDPPSTGDGAIRK
jgi:hypothetical protein